MTDKQAQAVVAVLQEYIALHRDHLVRLAAEVTSSGARHAILGQQQLMAVIEGIILNTSRATSPKTCGKCGSTIQKPGPCPVCEDKPYGNV